MEGTDSATKVFTRYEGYLSVVDLSDPLKDMVSSTSHIILIERYFMYLWSYRVRNRRVPLQKNMLANEYVF